MRRLAPVLLVLLVLTAGCANFLPWSHSESAHPQTTSNHPSSYPPGANGQWIFDAGQLVKAHEKKLNASNYRMHVRIRPNRSTAPAKWGNTTITEHVGGGHTLIQGEGGWVGTQLIGQPYRSYFTRNTTASCPPGPEQCSYVSGAPSIPQRISNGITPQIKSILSGSDFVASGTTVRNGTTLYRYEANGSTTLPDVSALSATVLIDEDGFIHDLSGTAHTNNGRPVTAEFDYRFSLVPNPPAKPSWMDGLPRLKVGVNANEFTLVHEGGEPVPAGTNISLILSNDTAVASGTVQLPKSLARGDVAHLVITEIQSTQGRQYRIAGNITVNHPPTSEPAINHTDWLPGIRFETKGWYLRLWEKPEVRNSTPSKTTNTTTTTTGA